MKYVDEYRDRRIAQKIVDEFRRTVTRPWVMMEVFEGQTHSILKYGLDNLFLKNTPHLAGVPIAVLTSSRAQSDRRRALTLGARYIEKPSQMNQFLASVGDAVSELLSRTIGAG